jgi:hypothetical protein
MAYFNLTMDFAWKDVGKPKISPEFGITDVRVSVALVSTYSRWGFPLAQFGVVHGGVPMLTTVLPFGQPQKCVGAGVAVTFVNVFVGTDPNAPTTAD